MDAVDFIYSNIHKELTKQGFTSSTANYCADKAVKHYKVTAKFSGGAYLDCVNYAGKMAMDMSVGVKFKQVKPKRSRVQKRPSEAWDF